ncbi:MAG: hypothetical protein EAZ35_02235 [Sphingobacteriia bacterium]|nr:MAG: hypothetical protein EAZ35_02235 [Sphingobacteriia bacterium]
MSKEKIKERQAAEQFFVNNLYDAKTISDLLSIREATISTWRVKYGWDKLREDTINNPVKMKSLIAKQMLLIAQGEKSTIDADALAKMFKVFEGISEKINPGIVAAVLKLLDEFQAKENPAHAILCLDYHKKFLNSIIQIYG